VSTSIEIAARSSGTRAYAACQQSRQARVIGVTSRGLYLLAPPQHIVFVSFERQRSPLTINLDRAFDQLRTIEVGATAQLSSTRLIFPAIEFSIFLPANAVWHCPLPLVALRSRAEQRQTLRTIAAGVLPRADSTGWAALLPGLADWPDASPLSAEHSALLDRLIGLRRAVQTGAPQQIIAGLTSVLGQGRGLTPSGDDLAIGLLLMLNRWYTARDWTEVNRTVIEMAYRTTTTISANLIECATDGQGDERLIILVDGIATGSASIDECVACVLGWGSSSGLDALIGMALAVS
jgi:hypothetical protein